MASGEDAAEAGQAYSDEGAERVEGLLGRATANSNTYLLDNGALETELFQAPVNYRDGDGDWKPIEEGLTELPSGALTNGANSFDVHLPEDLNESPIRVSLGEEWVSEIPDGVQISTADLGPDGAASYSAAGGSADFEFEGLANGLKESIELAGPSAPSTYRFKVDASAGVTPNLSDDGSIAFRDQDDQLVAEMPAPFMVDDAGVQAPPAAVHYALEENEEGSWDLAVEADFDWLQAEDRSWPVVIDPTITTVGTDQDCTIGSVPLPAGWKTCSASGGTELQAAYIQKESQPIRSLLRFNVFHVIPSDAYIHKATVSLYAPKAAENTPGLETRRLTKSWTTAVNWEKFGSQKQDLWNTPGGDFTTEGQAQILTSQRGSQAGWWEFSSESLRSLVAGWVAETTPNQGVMVKQTNETKAECEANPLNCNRRFVAFNAASASVPSELRPKLKLTYYLQAPASSKVVSPAEGTVTARRLKLRAGWTQGGVTGVTFQFREAGKGTFQTIPPELVRDAGGNPVSWPIAVSGVQQTKDFYFDVAHATQTLRKKGGAVQVRALFDGSKEVEGVSAPVEAELDRFIGGPGDAVAPVGAGSVDLLTGNLTIGRRDVSIPGNVASLAFSRTYNSRGVDLSKVQDHGESPYEREMKKVLGPGWAPGVPVEGAGAGDWRSIRMVETSEVIEGETYSFAYALLTSLDGTESSFEKEEGGSAFITPDELAGLSLTKNASGQFVLDNGFGEKVLFANNAGSRDYLPVEVIQTGGSGNTTQMAYTVINGNRRLNKIVAPSPPGVTCTTENATTEAGCKALTFTYTTYAFGDRLTAIRYYGANASGMTSPEIAKFEYTSEGWLKTAWDPRISPTLKETYTYTAGGQLATITPPGRQPWTFEYGVFDEEEANGRLVAVKRPTLLSSPAVAETTIVYGVPVSGGSAPYNMSATEVAKWGQSVIPVDATAVFGPSQVPANPPSSYSGATVYYMDSEGGTVNTASPPVPGSSLASISTIETDQFGNIVRELSPQNRIRALEAGSKSVERAQQIDTDLSYSPDGTELREEWGPLHEVKIAETGLKAEARAHTTIEYEAGLPVRETTGASVAGQGIDADQRVVETKYDPLLFSPTETIVDPGGLNIRRITKYDQTTGLPVETRQPSAPDGKGPGATRTVYYTHAHGSECELEAYAGLPCKIEPAGQPGTPGLPNLLVTKFRSYNEFGEPLEVTESPGGGSENVRKTTFTYDSAGRQKTTQTSGGGVQVPKVETLYSSSMGVPTSQRFVCPESEPGCDTQASTTTYDTLGRVTAYQDADGNEAKTTYDASGRPATFNDGKGTQTYGYDAASGLLTSLTDSAAGTFTAGYDADGSMIKRGLPNGLTAETVFDPAGAATKLTYTKATSCGSSCTWLNFEVARSVEGRVLSETGTQGTRSYGYDAAGRLSKAQETPPGGSCTTRAYAFDSNSNRTSKITRPGVGGACSESGGTTQGYGYDGADRLLGEGMAYDPFGRITNLPANLAGGKSLSTSYFSNDMVASQSQNGVTNTFQLDAVLRQRQRLQAGGLEGTEVFHYAGPGDSPSWTERGSTWTRTIIGIDGELAAVQENGKEITLSLTNLHGDVVGSAAISPTVTALKGTFAYDEFGNPTSGSAGRFGWVGGVQRRTELPSGIVQMGARSYVPVIGRFLSTDPVAGGSANSYDYGNADPVNQFDPSGLKPYDNDCYEGVAGCQCLLHIKMWSPKKARMGVRVSYQCNRFGGISRKAFKIGYELRIPEVYGGFTKIDTPHYLNHEPVPDPECHNYERCINHQDHQGTFECFPGGEYQITVYFAWFFNLGVGQGEWLDLQVQAQEYCHE
jgi:RHS repeat-associated protein